MATRFKLDENLPRDADVFLRDAGHEVQTVLEERLGGCLDSQVLNACRNEARVLITFDLDFADIRLYPPASHLGIWVLRPVSQSIASTVTLLRGALTLLETETPRKRLWIIEHGRVRIRD
jgi:predicted nuclease of predicted toxin-antitoxin system